MKKEIFDLCLDFHKGLIRTKFEPDTIVNAEKVLVDDDDKLLGISPKKRSRAKKLAVTLKTRLGILNAWQSVSWEAKCTLYKAASVRTPAAGVFIALDLVVNHDIKIGTAAEKCGVNFQCVKVLKPRFERYETYANKLKELMV